LNGTITHQVILNTAKVAEEHVQIMLSSIPVLSSTNKSYTGEGFTFTEQEALWALSMVKSRTFSDVLKSWESVPEEYNGGRGMTYNCLVPLGDMFNHKLGGNAGSIQRIRAEGDAKISVGFIAQERIEKGDPVYASYGSLQLEAFYNNYGFVAPESTPAFGLELVDIIQEQDSKDPLLQSRQKAYLDNGCVNIPASLKKRSYDQHLEELLLPCTRIVELTKDSLIQVMALDKTIKIEKHLDEMIIKAVAKPTSAKLELRSYLRLLKLHVGYIQQDELWKAMNPQFDQTANSQTPEDTALLQIRAAEMAFHHKQAAAHKAKLQKWAVVMQLEEKKAQLSASNSAN